MPHLVRTLVLALLAAFLAPPLLALTACVDGRAAGFPCRDVDLLAIVSARELGGETGSDVWGWTDPASGREYAIYTLESATAFIDVTGGEPVVLGFLPAPAAAVARDVKVYRDHAFIVGDEDGHGLQVFDLRRLREVRNPPRNLTADARYERFGHAHNLAINEETGFAYAARTDDCPGGLHMVDVRQPLAPRFAGCADAQGAVHDTQCVVYRGRDREHRGREICFNSNQDRVTLVDVTDKRATRILSRSDYPGRGFVHQGWLTEDHAFFLVNDEIDELRSGHNTRTYVWRLGDLEAPVLAGAYTGPTPATDHNLYIVGNYVFEANYTAGLRVLRLDNPAAARLTEVGVFDVIPGGDAPGFDGAWTAYPFFPSGNVVVSTIGGDLFVVRPVFNVTPGCPLRPGHPRYCQVCGPCGVGQGSCAGDDDCAAGLICAENFGSHFGFSPAVEVCARPRGLDVGFAATELPALVAGGATLDVVLGVAINDRGQVTGTATNFAEPPDLRTAAFRYSPEGGMEDLDPDGRYASRGEALNGRGDVAGVTAPGPRGLFLHRFEDGSGRGGFDFLERGSSPALQHAGTPEDLNDRGVVAISVFLARRQGFAPYRYSAAAGWESLADVHPDLRASSARPLAINDAGDVLIAAEGGPSRRAAYVVRGGRRVVEIGHLGTPVTVPLAMNEAGQVVGHSHSRASGGRRHAFLFTPETGLVDLHGGRFAESVAVGVTRKGQAGGVLFDAAGRPAALFTWDARRDPAFRVVALRTAFQRLMPAGAALLGLEDVRMNDRLDFVGRVRHDEGPPANPRPFRAFYFNAAVGLRDLQDVVDAAGLDVEVVDVVDLNDRGAIVLRVTGDDGRAGTVVLTPSSPL